MEETQKQPPLLPQLGWSLVRRKIFNEDRDVLDADSELFRQRVQSLFCNLHEIFALHPSPLTQTAHPHRVASVILFLVVTWLALVWWTYADARRRIDDPMLVGTATVASLFPFVGTLVYLIVRPPEYLEDVRERLLREPGVNFHFNEDAWREWYTETHEPTKVNLRRAE